METRFNQCNYATNFSRKYIKKKKNEPQVPLEACMPAVHSYCSTTTHENRQMPISEDNVQPSQYWRSDTVITNTPNTFMVSHENSDTMQE